MGSSAQPRRLLPRRLLRTLDRMSNRYRERLERARLKGFQASATEIKDPPLQDGDIVRAHGVLAGVYQGRGRDLGTTLTHALVEGHKKSVCGKIPADHLADFCERSPDCPTCVRKLRGHPITMGYEDDMTPNASSKLEWIKGEGVDRDGHSLAWWKSKAAKWSRSEYDRPKVFIRVITYDRAGQRDESRCGEFAADNLKGAKEFSKEAVESGGSSQIYGRVEIPYQSGVTFDIGEWKNNASNGYYVWSVDGATFVPVARNGPFENPDDAIALAKRVARGGQTYDAVITFGGDPESSDFEIWKSFKAWSGEVHYTTDLPRVGGRLREYR